LKARRNKPDKNDARELDGWLTLDGVDRHDYLEGKSPKSARDYLFYFSGATPSPLRYKNRKIYYTCRSLGRPVESFHSSRFTLHWQKNINRDPFEQAVGINHRTSRGHVRLPNLHRPPMDVTPALGRTQPAITPWLGPSQRGLKCWCARRRLSNGVKLWGGTWHWRCWSRLRLCCRDWFAEQLGIEEPVKWVASGVSTC
jgi:hypothetical protein